MPAGPAAIDRPRSHELLDDLPPVSALKEQISRAVVAMVATSVGMNVGNWSMDYDGYDVTLSSSHDYAPNALNPKLDVQLKCTGQEAAARADHVAWSLDARTTNYLAAPNRQNMAIFCVVLVPDHPGHWLTWPDEGLLAHCRAYFVRGQDLQPIPDGQASKTVHLPHTNLLTASALLDLMEEGSRWRIGE